MITKTLKERLRVKPLYLFRVSGIYSILEEIEISEEVNNGKVLVRIEYINNDDKIGQVVSIPENLFYLVLNNNSNRYDDLKDNVFDTARSFVFRDTIDFVANLDL